MLPNVAPRRSKCTAYVCAESGALERLPGALPRQQRGETHSRSYSKTSITVSQASRMLLHVVPGQPACLDRPSPHKLPPPERPRPIGPRKESPQSESAASSQAPGHPAFTAVFSFGGRMPSASLVPPGSWPCHPSTLRLSRSPQPSSRRVVRATHNPLLPPLPAAFCGRVPRLRRNPRPQNAMPYSSINLTITINQDPHNPRDLFDPSYSLRPKQQGVRVAHGHVLPPLRRRPPGAGRVAFCCGARLARVVAPAKGRMGRSPYPLCRARSLPPPQSAINVVAEINRVSHMQTVTLKAAGVRSPAVRSASVGRAVCAGLPAAGVALCILLRNVPGTPRKSSQVASDDRPNLYNVHLVRRATPCQSALVTSRQAVEAVGSYAQGLSCLAESRQGGNRHPLLVACRKARATAVRGTVGSRCSHITCTVRPRPRPPSGLHKWPSILLVSCDLVRYNLA